MWREDPELRLRMVNGRLAELRGEAAAARLAKACTDEDELPRFAGVRIQVGRLLIMIGRMSSEWAPPSSAAPPARPAGDTALT
jgi:hypothetical protein